ncbi:CARF isoform 16, partial [Pan troglodytes]
MEQSNDSLRVNHNDGEESKTSAQVFEMIVASPTENGQVLRVIPPTQTGMAQVIIPQGQLVDVNSPRDVPEEKPSDRNLPT